MNNATKMRTIEEVEKEILSALKENEEATSQEEIQADIERAKKLLAECDKTIRDTIEYIKPYKQLLETTTKMKKTISKSIKDLERKLEC